MNINRYNYEEYFLLYVDDELSTSERRAVEMFVEEHPDLEEELIMLKQTSLKPDASVVMEDKSSLFKTESSSVITLENFETYFLLYVDEELNTEERRAVETFAGNHPSLQQELNLLMQTKLEANESIVFPDKNVLYKVPVIGQRSQLKIYRIIAVAAMLLIAAGVFWVVRNGNGSSTGNSFAGKETESKNSQPAANNQEKKSEQQSPPVQQQVAQSGKHINKGEQPDQIVRSNKGNEKQNNIPAPLQEPKNNQIAFLDPRIDTSNTEPHVTYSSVASTQAVAVNAKGTDGLPQTLIVDRPVGEPTTATGVALTKYDDDQLGEGGGAPAQSKSKLRGFFRQVKRVVEKTARVPGEESKKLLIGNIEVAIK